MNRLFIILLSLVLTIHLVAEDAALYLNGLLLGTAPVEKVEETQVVLKEAFLTPPLKKALNENGQRIMGEILKKGYKISFEAPKFEKSIRFQAQREPLEIRLLVPPQLLEGYGLKNSQIAYREQMYQYPANRSFYINAMAGYKMLHNYYALSSSLSKKNAEIAKKNEEIARRNAENGATPLPEEPLLDYYIIPPQHETYANFDAVANIRQVVAQGYVYYVASEHKGLVPGNVLLSRDFEKRHIRLAAGNINYMTLGLQNSIPLFGLNLSKNQQLFTNTVIGPMSRNEFFLNVPSKIDVYIDNVYSTTLEAPAGPFLVSSFPIIQGLNNVRLKITGAAGEQLTLDLNTFFLAELLKKGEDNYAFTVGIPTYDFIKKKTAYLWDLPTASLMYRRGFGETFTAGVYVQGQQHQGYIGSQLVAAMGPIKNMLDIAMSKYNGTPLSYRARLQIAPYIPKDAKDKPVYNWKFVIDGMSRYFGYLGGPPAPQPVIFTFGGNVARDLPNDAKINLIANLGVTRSSAKAPRQATVTTEVQFQQTLYKDLVAKINASVKTVSSNPAAALIFALDYTPKDGKSKATASYNTQQQLAVLSGSQTLSFRGDRTLTISAGATKAPKTWNATGALNYQGVFAEAMASHYIAKTSMIDPDTTLGVSFFNVGSALVEADGVFAISRPVTDSFIIVLPDTREDNLFLLNPTPEGDYLARSNRVGRVVISKVPSYKPYDLEARDPVTGAPLQQSHRTLYPRYRSGSVVRIGREQVYTVAGRVLGGGLTVAEQTGMLIHADENPPRVWSVEIDERGRFRVDDIPAGDYILLLDNFNLQEASVTVDPDTQKVLKDGTIDLGDIAVNFSLNTAS